MDISVKKLIRKESDWFRLVLIRSRKGFSEDRLRVLRTGYTLKELNDKVESLFTEELNWDTFKDKWIVSHVKSVSKYLSEGVTDPAILHSLDNLKLKKINEPIEYIEKQVGRKRILNDDLIKEIEERLKDPKHPSQKDIAKEFNVSRSYISGINVRLSNEGKSGYVGYRRKCNYDNF